MIVYSVIVDEPPESCLSCPFSRKLDAVIPRGYCSALPPENNTVYRRHDCPMSFCTETAQHEK